MVLAGCGFEVAGPSSSIDASADADDTDAPDAVQITWTVDDASGNATPASAAEWHDFIVAHDLSMAAPDGLWLLQEASGVVHDSIGTIDLMPSGPVKYLQPVTGWTRKAVRTDDGTGASFLNTTATSLPDVGSTSMTILLVYQTASTPAAPRSVLFGGGGVPSTLGQLDVDAANHLVFTAGGMMATGTVSYDTDVLVAVMRLDRAANQNHLVTHREVIAPAHVPLGASRGLFLGGASHAAPAGRWLYMAAWYGSHAEMNDAELQRLLAALGW